MRQVSTDYRLGTPCQCTVREWGTVRPKEQGAAKVIPELLAKATVKERDKPRDSGENPIDLRLKETLINSIWTARKTVPATADV